MSEDGREKALSGRGSDSEVVERTRSASGCVPKLCGADVELGNFVLGVERPEGSGFEASRELLRAIRSVTGAISEPAGPEPGPVFGAQGWTAGSSSYFGYESPRYVAPCRPAHDTGDPGRDSHSASSPVYYPLDWGRSFLPTNGGCVYIDLDHLELCLPEVLSAYDHVAAWHAMLRVAQDGLAVANAQQPEGREIQALVNNSDGKGNAYGSHLDFLVTRRAWANLVERKLHHLAYLAAFQASSIVYSGQGKVGSENGAPPVAFQISQRADFFEKLIGIQTTYRRPLVNTRDEPLCGARWRAGRGELEEALGQLARLHVIFFDNTLCHTASLLKVGAMQIVLAMLEAERVNLDLALDDPLDAVLRWSHDPTLETRAPLTSGREPTAVEHQLLFLEDARRFVDEGGCEGIVPRAREILALWEDTLLKLDARDWGALTRRLDWVLKLSVLQRALQRRPELDWASPELKHLDHLYSSLDPEEGLYWAFERGGLVDTVVTEGEIARFVSEPPEDTRAWGRAMLLRRAEPGAVDDVDWDFIRFKLKRRGMRTHYVTVELADPLSSTHRRLGSLLERASTFDELVAGLDGKRERDRFDRPKNRLGGIKGGKNEIS